MALTSLQHITKLKQHVEKKLDMTRGILDFEERERERWGMVEVSWLNNILHV